MTQVSVLDVAQYILGKCSAPITTMKLQKLVYYSQAWHLAWTGTELFEDDIQAWANGPVTKALFDCHKGMYSISSSQFKKGSPELLTMEQQEVIDTVLDTYGPMTAMQLSMLTHAEAPWLSARGQLGAGENSAAVISKGSMQKYYRALGESPEAVHAAAEVNFPAWA